MSRLNIGIPSAHSRLHAKVMKLLAPQQPIASRQIVFQSSDVIVYLLRPWDLPNLVESGHLDVAVCGLDTVVETSAAVTVVEKFEAMKSPIAFCSEDPHKTESGNDRCVIATEYPNITKRFFAGRPEEHYDVMKIRGAAEAFPHLPGVSAMVDVVETGETAAANGLRVGEVITYTCPCIIRNNALNGRTPDLSAQEIGRRVAIAVAEGSEAWSLPGWKTM